MEYPLQNVDFVQSPHKREASIAIPHYLLSREAENKSVLQHFRETDPFNYPTLYQQCNTAQMDKPWLWLHPDQLLEGERET